MNILQQNTKNPFPPDLDGSGQIMNFIMQQPQYIQANISAICDSINTSRNIVKSDGETLSFLGGGALMRVSLKSPAGYYKISGGTVSRFAGMISNSLYDPDIAAPPLATMWDQGFLFNMTREQANDICVFITNGYDEHKYGTYIFGGDRISASANPEFCLLTPIGITNLRVYKKNLFLALTEMQRYPEFLIGAYRTETPHGYDKIMLFFGVNWQNCVIISSEHDNF